MRLCYAADINYRSLLSLLGMIPLNRNRTCPTPPAGGYNHPQEAEPAPVSLAPPRLPSALISDNGEGGKEDQDAPLLDIDSELAAVDAESEALRQEQYRAARSADAPTAEMYAECQELLQIFGLPFIVAPVEVSFQCGCRVPCMLSMFSSHTLHVYIL